jgi:hypothetical protein
MPEPGRQERLRAVLADQRLPAEDPGLPLSALLERDDLFSAAIAQNRVAWGALGEKRPAPHAVETHSAMLPVT